LKTLGEFLGDFHGPHEHQSLLSTDTQRRLLDKFGGYESLMAQTRDAWKGWRAVASERAAMEAESGLGTGELDLLRYQADEIAKAGLKPGEEAELSDAVLMARNSRRLVELCGQLGELLDDGEGCIVEKLAAAHRLASELASLDKRCIPFLESLDQASVLVRDAATDVAKHGQKLDLDPARLAAIEERYNLIQLIAKKYGGSVERALEYEARARERLARFENRDESLAEVRQKEESSQRVYALFASELTKKRRAFSGKLSQSIVAQLRDLGFPSATLEIEIRTAQMPGIHGLDDIEFLFSPNPGEGTRPLKSIASSGEMARVMLAIKTCLAAQDDVPLLVFDEVDANVGGEVGTEVGRKLQMLGESHQVVCITHLPQVAALGESHFMVSKKTEGGRTFTELHPLDKDGRVEEIARMLGGVSFSSRKHAKTLLKGD